MAWYDFLNPILYPLLELGPFWAVVVVSLVISLAVTLVYKLVTNQELMKKLKEEQKEYQKRMKSLKDNPQEMMRVQKEAMKKNMEYMKHSFKSTLITILPLLLIFGWMSAHLTYEPIQPGMEYSITAIFDKGTEGRAELIPDKETELISNGTKEISGEEITWKLKSKTEGTHSLKIKFKEEAYEKEVLITKEPNYITPIKVVSNSELKQIRTNQVKLTPLGQGFSIFGWEPGWLGLYVIFSIIFSMGLRKVLKVY